MQKFEEKRNIFKRFLSKIPWPKTFINPYPQPRFSNRLKYGYFIVLVL